MDRYSLQISPSSSAGAAPLTFDVPDLRTALIVTDINMPAGVAEVWRDDRRIASVRRAGGKDALFWQVC